MTTRARGRPRSADSDATTVTPGVASLSRGLELLDALASAGGPLGNRELAAATGLPNATVSRLTQTLVQCRYLSHEQQTARYALGPGALALGYAALNSLDIRRVARPIMQRLAEAAGFNVGLALRSGDWMVYTDTVEGASLVNLRLVPGSRVPIATSAIGRAYVAALPSLQRQTVLEQLEPLHGEAWPDLKERLQTALDDYLRLGFCASIGDWQRDISAIAAPIPIFNGQGPYALNLGGPSYLLPATRLRKEFGPMLAAAASEIRRRME